MLPKYRRLTLVIYCLFALKGAVQASAPVSLGDQDMLKAYWPSFAAGKNVLAAEMALTATLKQNLDQHFRRSGSNMFGQNQILAIVLKEMYLFHLQRSALYLQPLDEKQSEQLLTTVQLGTTDIEGAKKQVRKTELTKDFYANLRVMNQLRVGKDFYALAQYASAHSSEIDRATTILWYEAARFHLSAVRDALTLVPLEGQRGRHTDFLKENCPAIERALASLQTTEALQTGSSLALTMSFDTLPAAMSAPSLAPPEPAVMPAAIATPFAPPQPPSFKTTMISTFLEMMESDSWQGAETALIAEFLKKAAEATQRGNSTDALYYSEMAAIHQQHLIEDTFCPINRQCNQIHLQATEGKVVALRRALSVEAVSEYRWARTRYQSEIIHDFALAAIQSDLAAAYNPAFLLYQAAGSHLLSLLRTLEPYKTENINQRRQLSEALQAYCNRMEQLRPLLAHQLSQEEEALLALELEAL